MAFTFVDSVTAYTAGATSLSAAHSFAVGDLLVGLYAFQGVSASSGPWSSPNVGQYATDHIGPASGWQQVCWQAPSATGVGIEVWAAINGTTSPGGRILAFNSSQQCQLVMGAWTGAYAPNGTILDGAVRVATTAQPVGNAPAAPSVYANASELVIALGGDLMGAGGFGTPPGFTQRLDVAGGGAGNVEATIADAAPTVPGATGLIVFPNNAAASSTAGATATLAVRPALSVVTAGEIVDAPMPPDLDLGAGYTLRVTALDPATGATVSGVTISTTVLTASQASSNAGSGGGSPGDWMLVPGINA